MRDSLNATLTPVGAGTPMGELMRRYWHPVAAVEELEERATKPLRILGEDLVLYKDLGGRYGLLERHCAHRNADLSCGYVEENGLRCAYHGWAYDGAGRCTDQPFEAMLDPESRFKEKIRLKAYRAQAKAGMLWAYMGPEPAPLLPDWEPYSWKNGFSQVVFAFVPCNWFQGQENSIDPVHFEWQHSNFKLRREGKRGPYSPRHTKLAFDEFEFGFTYRRIREDTDETDELWTIGRVCLWPNALFTSNHFEWRVPIDDENTLSVTWSFARVPKEREPYEQKRVPYWYGPITEPATGRWIESHVMNQDFMAWAGQGRITDRGRERLGRSDAGIIAMRRRFLADLEAIARGEDPKGLIRDPAKNLAVRLPIVGRKFFVEGLTVRELEMRPDLALAVTPKRYVFQFGIPDHVVREYEEAMGFKMETKGFVDP